MSDYFKTLKIVLISVFLLGGLVVVLSINVAQGKEDERQARMENLDYFKSFTLTGLDDEEFTPNDIAANKVTVFNGWAPWCTACVDEMPDLEALSKEYEGSGLQIVGVVADYYQKTKDSPSQEYDEKIRNSVKATGVTYPILVSDMAFYDALNLTITGYPTTWVVDSDGRLIDCLSSAMDTDEWREYFDTWLESAK